MKNLGRQRTLAMLVIVAVLTAIAAWSVIVEPASMRVTEVTVTNDKWPTNRRPLTIAVLSDLHVGSPYIDLDKLSEIVHLTNSLKPDLIVLLGDYVNMANRFGGFVPPEKIAKSWAKLSAPFGVHAVLGNHDWWLNGARVRAALGIWSCARRQPRPLHQRRHRHLDLSNPLQHAA